MLPSKQAVLDHLDAYQRLCRGNMSSEDSNLLSSLFNHTLDIKSYLHMILKFWNSGFVTDPPLMSFIDVLSDENETEILSLISDYTLTVDNLLPLLNDEAKSILEKELSNNTYLMLVARYFDDFSRREWCLSNLGQPNCNYVLNELISNLPFDGRSRYISCPKCGLKTLHTNPRVK